ncbi:MAG TPA: hypothetical protein VMT34_18365 [Aggregatilineales bacterium]|nr:hypothetical protein [Aggregatilineales bacterium]
MGSGDEQRMIYESVEAMAAAFRQAASMLEDIRNGLDQVATAFEGGAFSGNHGKIAQDALRNKIMLALQIADQKFNDLSKELHDAVTATQTNDSTVGGRFVS